MLENSTPNIVTRLPTNRLLSVLSPMPRPIVSSLPTLTAL